MSPSTKAVDLGRKMELYAQGGCTIYWVVDPETDTIRMYYNEGGRFELGTTVEPNEVAFFEMVFDFEINGPVLFRD